MLFGKKLSFVLAVLLSFSSCKPAKNSQSSEVKSSENTLSSYQVRAIVNKHFSHLDQDGRDKMYCIAYAESNFDAGIVSYVGARGLFQIMPVHMQGGEACETQYFADMFNPDENARCASKLQKSYQGMDAWDPYYFAQRTKPGDANYYHAEKYLSCRRGAIGWGE